jgi:hypothetical protein
MIQERFFNSGELSRGVFDPFYGKYRSEKVRNKIFSGTGAPTNPSEVELEFSIYDGEQNLRYWKRGVSYDINADGNFEADVFSHVEDADIPDGGNYILRYNFFIPEIGDQLYVQSVSGNGREVKIRPDPDASESFKQGFFSLLKRRFQDVTPNNYEDGEKALTLVGNFGENNYRHILNWSPVVETLANGDVEINGGDPVLSGSGIFRFETAVSQNVEVGDSFRVDIEASRPYFDRFEIFRSEEITAVNTLAGPDFTVDAETRNKGRDAEFESLDEITQGKTFETSKNFLQSRISGSKAVDLNVDFTDFDNFIQYSSAEERIKNFKFKIEKIYQTIQDLKSLEVPGGQTETLKREVESVIGSFDAYERFLFQSENGYPKNDAGALVEPENAEQWFREITNRARIYDGQNDSALRKQVPEFVRENPDNEKFLLFVDMIGHWFDVNWLYIRHIGNVSSTSENAFDPETLSADLSSVVAESLGFETFNGFNAEKFFDEIFDRNNIETLFDSTDVAEPDENREVKNGKVNLTRYEAQQQVWRRFLRNAIHFYKNKAALDSVDAITNILGIPADSLIVRESGGSLSDGQKVKLREKSNYLSFLSSQVLDVPWGSSYQERTRGFEMRFRSEFQGGRSMKLFEIANVLEVRIEKSGLNTEQARLVLDVRTASGNRETLQTREIPVFNGEWTNVLFQVQEDDPAFELSVRQRSPFGNFRFSDDLAFKVNSRLFPQFFNAESLFVGGTSRRPFLEGISFVGDVDQVNIWKNRISLEVFEEHVLAPKKYNYEAKETSNFASIAKRLEFGREELLFRTDFASQDSFPNVQNVAGPQNGVTNGGFDTDAVNEFERTNFFQSVQVGNTAYVGNKTRVGEKDGPIKLYPDRKRDFQEKQISEDSRRLGMFFSPYTSANRDAISEIGIKSINETLGDPREQLGGDYKTLDGLRKNYWEKYEKPIDAGIYTRYVDQFYDALFNHLEKTVPARASYSDGILIEPTVLERERQKLPTGSLEIDQS